MVLVLCGVTPEACFGPIPTPSSSRLCQCRCRGERDMTCGCGSLHVAEKHTVPTWKQNNALLGGNVVDWSPSEKSAMRASLTCICATGILGDMVASRTPEIGERCTLAARAAGRLPSLSRPRTCLLTPRLSCPTGEETWIVSQAWSFVRCVAAGENDGGGYKIAFGHEVWCREFWERLPSVFWTRCTLFHERVCPS